jgi:hypothetical protein
MIEKFADRQLSWMPEVGIGYYPVKDSPYDAEYFVRVTANSRTQIGVRLNQARLQLVDKYLGVSDTVLDIGIGSGAFVEACQPRAKGFDINPVAIEWLTERGLYRAPYRPVHSMTFWDSLEHIHDPTEILKNIECYAFVSMPIYRSLDHLMGSKHRRYDEHCWYFTHDGIKLFMGIYGFDLVEHNQMETEIGREDIGTFVFKRA